MIGTGELLRLYSPKRPAHARRSTFEPAIQIMKTKTYLATFLFAAATSLGIAATAQENWTSQCAKCHGADGSGKTTIGKKLKLADYTTAEAQAAFTDDEATNVITNGIVENGKVKKNPFKEKLTPGEIADLVKHVRGFGPK